MTRLPQVDAIKLLRALKHAGFVEHAQRGSHLTLQNPHSGRRTTVPIHGGDIKRGLLKQILKQSGITEKQFAQWI